MPHYVASNLGLHCLPMPLLQVSTYEWIRGQLLNLKRLIPGIGTGGWVVLSKLPVPGRPSNLADSRARAYCACSGCGWGCLDIFTLIYLFSPLSPSLWETARYRLSSIPARGKIFSTINRVPLHTAFHYQPSIVLI